jgi:hypothetical protein
MSPASDTLLTSFVRHADIGHLALLIWALAASCLVAFAVREAADSSRRTEIFMHEFLQELSRFNRRHDFSRQEDDER